MGEILDDCEFWLPPQFLADDDTLMDRKSNSNLKSAKDVFGFETTEYAKSLFPLESPYGFGSFGGFSSDLSSPVESVVGSTETESDEEDYYLAGLTRRMAHSTLEDDVGRNDLSFDTENKKGWVVSGSPQSTLCAVGSGCGCRQGSSRGSPNGTTRVPSPPTTWNLLYAAAGEVARMTMNEELYGFNSQNRGVLVPVPPRKPSPVSVYPQQHQQQQHQHCLSDYQRLQAAQFRQLRQQQMMKQQRVGVWGGQAKGTTGISGVYNKQHPQQQQTLPVVHDRGRDNITLSNTTPGRSLGLSASAWPPLQQAQPQHHPQGGSGMRAVFLGNPGGRRECAGTGVFLPRRIGTPNEPRKKPACSTVLLPARVVQALNLNLDDRGAQPQFQNRFNGSFAHESDMALSLRNGNYMVSHQKRNLTAQPGMNSEVRLPQEWTY